MKKSILLLTYLFLGFTSFAQIFPVTDILVQGEESKRINFVFVGDGYMSNEIPEYITDVHNIGDNMFSDAPFSNYASFFNLYAIEVPSNESGAGQPNGTPVDNYFGSVYGYQGIQRLLVPTDNYALAMVFANNFPAYDQGFILVNSDEYGGSGGSYATSSTHPSAPKIAVHEIGHSFAGLSDEYWAGSSYAMEDHNMTANTDAATVKWSEWMGEDGVGIFPHGTSGTAANWHRPHQYCKMRSLNYPFCPVCKERFIDKIYALVSPIESFLPTNSDVIPDGTGPIDFSLNLVLPSPNTLKVSWLLNGQEIHKDVASISIDPLFLKNGSNALEAVVVDTTLMSKTYAPSSGYVFTVSWNIERQPQLPIELSRFEAYPKDGKVMLEWTTATEINNEKFVIQRSNDGINFETIGEKRGKGQSHTSAQYSFLDVRPLEGNNYYRLQQVDYNGEFEYSPIRTANFVRKFFYKIYPNPAQNNLYLQYYNSDDTPLQAELTDLTGRIIKRLDKEIKPGSNEVKIDIAELPKGIFFLRLFNQGYQESFKVLKN